MAEMHSLAVQLDDGRCSGCLNSDAAVLATMAAAVDVVEADGIRVDPVTTPTRTFAAPCSGGGTAAGPVDALHRSCSAAITRGSLRLLDGGTGVTRTGHVIAVVGPPSAGVTSLAGPLAERCPGTPSSRPTVWPGGAPMRWSSSPRPSRRWSTPTGPDRRSVGTHRSGDRGGVQDRRAPPVA